MPPSLYSSSPEPSAAQSRSISKRKRADTTNSTAASRPPGRWRRIAGTTDDDDYDDDSDDNHDEAEDSRRGATQPRANSRLEWVFDPDQPIEERRRLQAQYRELLRSVDDNAEEFLKPESRGIEETLRKAGALSEELHVTYDATIDSRLLLNTADLAIRKAKRMTQGTQARGVNVNEFITRLIRFMRRADDDQDDDAPGLSGTQRQRRARADDTGDAEESGYDNGDMYDWSYLGRQACVPHLRRPQLSSFLIGPLSVEKKVRKIAKRAAPLRTNTLQETRPEVLRVEDLANKKDDLASTCARILQTMARLQGEIQTTLSEAIDPDADHAEARLLMYKHGLRSTGGIDLMRFVVNPWSFQQTVENVFYVSFLIRDGRAKLEIDEHGLYSVAPVVDEDGDAGQPGAAKHQGILSIDEATWRDIVATLKITQPMIDHRQDAASEGPGARGWYS